MNSRRPIPAEGSRGRRRSRGFTLIEVILAVSIATGILVVALVFYSQTANLRGQLISEAERLSALRLVMDRLVADLSSAFEQPQVGFTGTTDSMEFVVTRAFDRADPVVRLQPATTDLRRVSYYLTASLEGTNFVVTGLERIEESLVAKPGPKASSVTASAVTETAAAASAGAPLSSSSSSNAPGGISSSNRTELISEPMGEPIRFARFRYWDGTDWLEAWDSPGLPPAVEINLGLDPLPEAELPDNYPSELFRRVVILPAHAAGSDWWSEL